MRVKHGESGESAPPEPESIPPPARAAFDAGVRSESAPVGVALQFPAAGKRISAAMSLLGVALLWPVPLAGALLLVAGGLGLAISSEADLTPTAAMNTSPAADQSNGGTPLDPQPEGLVAM